MTTELDDGVGRYASRVRVNRRVLDIVGDGTGSISNTIDMNGKIQRIVLDMSRMATNTANAADGSIDILMDGTADGGTQYSYCDTISSLDYQTSSNSVIHFQISEGANTDTAGVHLKMTGPGGAASWNGLVMGKITFKLTLGNSKVFTSGAAQIARVVIIHE